MVRRIKEHTMVAENNTRETVESDFTENLNGLINNLSDTAWREKYLLPSMVRINELGKEKETVDEVIADFAMLGMAYVTLMINEAVDLATKDTEGNGG